MTVQVGVESGVKTGLSAKGLDRAQLGKAIGQGLQRGITQVAIESAAQKAGMSALESGAAARFLSGVLDGIADPNKTIPQGVFEAMSESLKNTITLGGSSNDPYEQALYISKVIDFSQDIRDKGLEAALEKRAASVFSRDALNNIVRSAGSISNYIGKKEKENKVQVIDYNGLKAKFLEIEGSEDYLIYGDKKDALLARRSGNKYQEGKFGIGQDGRFGIIDGTEIYLGGDGTYTVDTFERGRVTRQEVNTGDKEYSAYGYETRPLKLSDAVGKGVWDGVIEDSFTGTKLRYEDGRLTRRETPLQVIRYEKDKAGNTTATYSPNGGNIEEKFGSDGRVSYSKIKFGGDASKGEEIRDENALKLIDEWQNRARDDSQQPPIDWDDFGGATVPGSGVGTFGMIGMPIPTLNGPVIAPGVVLFKVDKGVVTAGTSRKDDDNDPDKPGLIQRVKDLFGKNNSQKPKYVYDSRIRRYRNTETGRFVAKEDLPWPADNGFEYSQRGTLQTGKIIDRYGSNTGFTSSEPGTTISERGLPPGSEKLKYHRYEVIKPLEADIGPAKGVPEYNASGGGTQYYFNSQSIQQLINSGFLREIK